MLNNSIDLSKIIGFQGNDIRVLEVHKGYGDFENTFGVRVGKPDVRRGEHKTDGMISFDLSVKAVSLHNAMDDPNVEYDYYGLSQIIMIADSYREGEVEQGRRMRDEVPVENGDLVCINGEVFQAKVKGNYSDCVEFYPTQWTLKKRRDEG